MTETVRTFFADVAVFIVRWRVAVAVAVLSFVAVASVCYITWQEQVAKHHLDFQNRVDTISTTIADRLNRYEIAMEMARGLFSASDEVRRDEWRRFATSERLNKRVPGAYGFAYVKRVAPEDLEEFVRRTREDGAEDFTIFDTPLYEPASYTDYCVIKYSEPVERNRAAIGLNVASVPASSDTMWRSVEHDHMAVSHMMALQQTGTTQPGVVMYLPIFSIGADISTSKLRHEAVQGWIAMAIAMRDFMTGQWAQEWEDIDVVLCEDTDDGTTNTLFVSTRDNRNMVLEGPKDHMYRSDIPVGDWNWVLYARDPDPAVAMISMPVIRVAGGGGAFGVLLVLLTWSLTRTRDQAERMAQELTVSLRRSERRYALAIQGSQDGLWDWDLVTDKVYYAPRWKELLGLGQEEISDQPAEWFSRIVSSELARFHSCLTRHIDGETERFDVEVEMHHADGTTRWMLCRAAAVRDTNGKALRVAGSLADITDLKIAQDELHSLAHHDRLTGLANRALFTERLGKAIAKAKRNQGYRFAVLFLDSDRFKVINDSMGHSVGDRLLVGLADRIRGEVRENDTVARFGGDEFVILVEDVRGVADAEDLSDRLLSVLSQPFSFDACEVVTTVSIGVVGSEFGYETADEMIRDADAAMYQAKAGGKARYCLFDAQMHTQAVRRMKLEQDLRNSKFHEQFRVFYQPIVSLDSGQVTGFEALVRWEHPEYGQVQPDEFIGISEETGLIVELGQWVLYESCRQLAIWRQQFAGAKDIGINVNLSKRQIVSAGLLPMIRETLEKTGIPPEALKLEITESTVMDNQQSIISVMAGIQSIGVQLAMDDFGTGHSSLSCLHQFPIDQLKIDRGFITNMQEHREFAAVMDAIVTLAHFLHLDVLAEGVENEDQLAQLQAMDCKFGQGYLFAKPMPADEATRYLSRQLFDAEAA